MESLRRRVWVCCLIVIALALLAASLAAGCGDTEESLGGPSSSASISVVDGTRIEPDSGLSALVPERIKGRGALKVASGFPYAPWEYYDPPTSKNPAGFDYDLGQAIGAKLGVKVEFVNTPWDSMILSVKGGKNDMIMAAMYDTPERQQELTFVDYAWDGTAILVRDGNPSNITNLESLSGKTVSVVRGTSQEGLLKNLNEDLAADGKAPVRVLALPGGGDEIVAVVSGKSAAVLQDFSVSMYTAKTAETGGKKTFECLQDPAAPHGYEPSMVGIGISKDEPELATAVQKALQALIDEGFYQRLIDKYGLLPVDSALINQGGSSAGSSSTE